MPFQAFGPDGTQVDVDVSVTAPPYPGAPLVVLRVREFDTGEELTSLKIVTEEDIVDALFDVAVAGRAFRDRKRYIEEKRRFVAANEK